MTTISNACKANPTECNLQGTGPEKSTHQIMSGLSAILKEGIENKYGINYTAELVFEYAQKHKIVLDSPKFKDLKSTKEFVKTVFELHAKKQEEQKQNSCMDSPADFMSTLASITSCVIGIIGAPETLGGSLGLTVGCGATAAKIYECLTD